jgi:hypothetical protein
MKLPECKNQKEKHTFQKAMDKKYIQFYQSFHKAFQNKKSNSLFELNQSQ